MPDALSKTVPIWCSVINRALFGDIKNSGRKVEELNLFTPPNAVGESEHAQIEKRVDGFVEAFLNICRPNIPQLRAKLQKPLRPIWVTQQSSLPDSVPNFVDFHPIVLCTASRRVRGAEASENGYIQGAADDHEAWSHGLTPTLFWKNKDLLLATSEEDAPELIEKLLSEDSVGEAVSTLIKPTKNIFISSSEQVDLTAFNMIISCTPDPFSPQTLKESKVTAYLHLKCQSGKLGSRDLRTQLPQIYSFFSNHPATDASKILVCCPTGKDLSVGTALAILCLYANDDGQLDTSNPRASTQISKNLIKQRLSWITTSNPALNPSRTTLQSVNAVVLQSQDPKALVPKTTTTAPTLHATLPIRTSRTISSETAIPHSTSNPPSAHLPPHAQPPCIPTLLFSALQTPSSSSAPWTFTRTLASALPTHPSGSVTGTATFTPCALPSGSPPTLLYAEEGEFVTDTGLRFTARRKYVYQLRDGGGGDEEGEEKGKYIAVYFFDDEKMPRASASEGVGADGRGIGGLFVEMDGLTAEDDEDGDGRGVALRAKNREQHLCAADLYTASWRFGAGMARPGEEEAKSDVWWEVEYDVQGPKKGYVSRTRYTRA
ncbi:hypothetical protein IQ07DRAFT_586897 [Pyrenochaeta sp. DS3sAY3a]|nr:hypothetical protein IQ07DRAFT_586897 [Pyrenochaeta sp. DS3sAY3a]